MSTKYNVFTNNLDLVNSLDAVVVGPGISTDNAIARFDGTTGKLLQNSGVLISDTDAVTGMASLALDIGATIDEFSTDGTLAGNSDTALPTEKAVKTYVDNSTPTVNLSPKEYWFAAESLQPLETNSGAIKKLAGSNVSVFVRAFDDATEQYANGKIKVPSDIDTSGTVTFRSYVSAATAALSKNIGLTFGHLALNDSEDWDPSSPYTEEDSGAKSIDATQDDVTEVTWTETVSNLGWAANDLVIFRISRDTGVTDDLTGDMYMFSLSIEIPRSS